MAKINKDDLLMVAVDLSMRHGYTNITRDGIAARAGVAMGTVTNVLGTMHQLKRAVIRKAIRTENLRIIAQAVALKDPLVKKLNPDLKQRVLDSL